MKVSELITHLQQLPTDLEVLVEGYETGFDPDRVPGSGVTERRQKRRQA